MAHFLLLYDLAPDYAERRGAYRDAHLAYAWAAADRGDLVLGGALSDPMDRAVLLFRCDDVAVVEAFVRDGTYVAAGIVVGWRVRAWTTVVGEGAETPVGR